MAQQYKFDLSHWDTEALEQHKLFLQNQTILATDPSKNAMFWAICSELSNRTTEAEIVH